MARCGCPALARSLASASSRAQVEGGPPPPAGGRGGAEQLPNSRRAAVNNRLHWHRSCSAAFPGFALAAALGGVGLIAPVSSALANTSMLPALPGVSVVVPKDKVPTDITMPHISTVATGASKKYKTRLEVSIVDHGSVESSVSTHTSAARWLQYKVRAGADRPATQHVGMRLSRGSSGGRSGKK